ncbi:hypothetical protein VaNZ11_012468 [Volvox africanus]|uniref:Uncharacterized protein n=1 Tax=Volvox africanus TaxID=51714 RepID=A0ABQ5SF65_9CHLO|nr:hypothetical protein VaNZ11_012468 [Volvox africanus]
MGSLMSSERAGISEPTAVDAAMVTALMQADVQWQNLPFDVIRLIVKSCLHIPLVPSGLTRAPVLSCAGNDRGQEALPLPIISTSAAASPDAGTSSITFPIHCVPAAASRNDYGDTDDIHPELFQFAVRTLRLVCCSWRDAASSAVVRLQLLNLDVLRPERLLGTVFPELYDLDLSLHTGLYDEDVPLLTGCRKLAILKLNGQRITSTGIALLGSLTSLQRLDISCGLVRYPLALVLQALPGLQHVTIRCCASSLLPPRAHTEQGQTGSTKTVHPPQLASPTQPSASFHSPSRRSAPPPPPPPGPPPPPPRIPNSYTSQQHRLASLGTAQPSVNPATLVAVGSWVQPPPPPGPPPPPVGASFGLPNPRPQSTATPPQLPPLASRSLPQQQRNVQPAQCQDVAAAAHSTPEQSIVSTSVRQSVPLPPPGPPPPAPQIFNSYTSQLLQLPSSRPVPTSVAPDPLQELRKPELMKHVDAMQLKPPAVGGDCAASGGTCATPPISRNQNAPAPPTFPGNSSITIAASQAPVLCALSTCGNLTEPSPPAGGLLPVVVAAPAATAGTQQSSMPFAPSLDWCAKVPALQSLHVLDVRGHWLEVTSLSKLTQLVLKDNSRPPPMGALQAMAKGLKALRRLELYGSSAHIAGPDVADAMSQFTRLESFTMDALGAAPPRAYQPKDFDHLLRGLVPLGPRPTSLVIRRPGWSPGRLRVLAPLTGLTRLEVGNSPLAYKLKTIGGAVGGVGSDVLDAGVSAGAGFKVLSSFFPKLRVFSLGPAMTRSATEQGVQALASCLTGLTSLNLEASNTLRDVWLGPVLGRMTSLCSLDLSNCLNLMDSTLSHLTSLSNLTTLRLRGCWKINGKGLGVLRPPLLRLRQLDLSDCRICDEGLQEVAHLTRLTSLELVRCWGVRANGLAALSGLTHLAALNLGSTNTDDVGVTLLVRDLGVSMTDLNLAATLITHEGAMALAQALPRLRRLSFSKCSGVDDQALQYLSSLVCLRRLHLKNCRNISDVAVRKLAEKLPRLQHLELNGSWGVAMQTIDKLYGKPNAEWRRPEDVAREEELAGEGRGGNTEEEDLDVALRSLW